MTKDVTKKMSAGGLIWETLGNRPCNEDENVESETQRGYAKNNRRDRSIDLPKIARERTSEEQQRSLQHQW